MKILAMEENKSGKRARWSREAGLIVREGLLRGDIEEEVREGPGR